MKYKIIITVLVLSIVTFPLQSYGQDSLQVEKPLIKDIQIDFGLGFLNNNHRSLNTVLQNNGWAKLNEGLLTYSISAKALRGRFLFGFQWMGYESSVNKVNDLQTNLRGYLVAPYIGYAVIRTDKFRVSPYIGLNASFSSLRLRDYTPVNDFSSVWGASRREAAIDFNSYALDFGIQGERIFTMKNRPWDCPQNTKYLAVGLKAGYYLNLSESNNGRFNSQRFSDSPTFNLSGFYGTLTISGGTRLRQLKWR